MRAVGMASLRLPSTMPGLRMEKGTAASGGLETWSVLEGMPGWAGLGATVRAAKGGEGFPGLQSKQREGPGAPERRRPPAAAARSGGKNGKKLQVSFPGGKQQNTKIKISMLNDCRTAGLLPRELFKQCPRPPRGKPRGNDRAPLGLAVGGCRV